MNCPNCGRDNPAEARFCGNCGTALSAPQSPQPSATAPGIAPAAVAVEYAGFWRRMAALLLDGIIIWLALIILTFFFRFNPAFMRLALGSVFVAAVSVILSLVIFLGPMLYYVLLTGLRGQTVGKMALGIRVVNERGDLPGLGRAALREIVGKLVSTIALGLGFLWVAWDARKQGWHDKIARTVVIRMRR